MSKQQSMTARTGRDKQRYSESGERLVAGVVPLSADKTRVLLIQSSRRTAWVLPKGGWETDEATASDAARREAWEEAGIHCVVTRDLGKILDTRGPKELSSSSPKALYQFYQVRVEKEEAEWPEKHKRGRQWMSYGDAKEKLKGRPELVQALERSEIVR
ncbi:hypothetical protein MMC11_002429 [Xylographa trunciseda]|nr:hypothetical protein [Xylographa trunciseda]